MSEKEVEEHYEQVEEFAEDEPVEIHVVPEIICLLQMLGNK